jgi:hypothetical protein
MGPYKPAAYLACCSGGTLGKRKRDHLLIPRVDFNHRGLLVFSGVINGAFTGYRIGGRDAFLFLDEDCFDRRFIPSVSVSGGDYDLGLNFFYRLLYRNNGRRNRYRYRRGHGFLFYPDHHFGRVGGRNRFFPLSFLIVFLPLNEFYFGFLGVI